MDGYNVLKKRCDPYAQWREKEWWFSYLFDPAKQLYLSWSIVRAFYTDHVAFMLVSLATGRKQTFSKLFFLDSALAQNGIQMGKQSAGFEFALERSGEKRQFRLNCDELSAQITYDPSTVPLFSKHENQFLNNYRLVHVVRSPATATISIGDERHELATTWSYQDHCSGLVPRVASWHWLSVQNDTQALVILTCYGNRPQRYAQLLYNDSWIRLDQNSSFEYRSQTRATRWHVTSPDVDVAVEILASHSKEVRVPKLVPFVVNVRHEEFVVRVCGSVRVHGIWHDINNLYGVMEEHHGHW